MFAGFIAVEIVPLVKENFTIKMPDTVPDFIIRSFEMFYFSNHYWILLNCTVLFVSMY